MVLFPPLSFPKHPREDPIDSSYPQLTPGKIKAPVDRAHALQYSVPEKSFSEKFLCKHLGQFTVVMLSSVYSLCFSWEELLLMLIWL